jgi:hypothetical protein
MKNITDLRATLFDTLEAIKAGKLDIDRAKAINEVAQTIINTAKVEVDHMKISGGSGSEFIAGNEYQPPALPGKEIRERTGHGTRTVQMLGGGATLTTHRAT